MPTKTKFVLLGIVFILAVAWCANDGYFLFAPPNAQRDILATCLVLEAGSEGYLGMQAVMNVIINRAGGNPGEFYAQATRENQFSSLNSARSTLLSNYHTLIDRAKQNPAWVDAQDIVRRAQVKGLSDLTNGATHFYSVSKTPPAWAKNLSETSTIGKHRFLH